MPLKKMPANLSYEAIRHRHPPKQSDRPAPQLDEKPSANGPVKRQQTDEQPVSTGKTIRTESNKPTDDLKPDVSPDPEPKKPARKPTLQKNKASDEIVKVRGYVSAPPIGMSHLFDELREIYGESICL